VRFGRGRRGTESWTPSLGGGLALQRQSLPARDGDGDGGLPPPCDAMRRRRHALFLIRRLRLISPLLLFPLPGTRGDVTSDDMYMHTKITKSIALFPLIHVVMFGSSRVETYRMCGVFG
jgi:hypothetical protein